MGIVFFLFFFIGSKVADADRRNLGGLWGRGVNSYPTGGSTVEASSSSSISLYSIEASHGFL